MGGLSVKFSWGETIYHGAVSSGWINIWHNSHFDPPDQRDEHITVFLGMWAFCLTLLFSFRSKEFGGAMAKLYQIYQNCSFSSGWCIVVGCGSEIQKAHRPWSLWVQEHWEWVPSLMFLFIGNLKMCPQDAGTCVISSWWVPFEF